MIRLKLCALSVRAIIPFLYHQAIMIWVVLSGRNISSDEDKMSNDVWNDHYEG